MSRSRRIVATTAALVGAMLIAIAGWQSPPAAAMLVAGGHAQSAPENAALQSPVQVVYQESFEQGDGGWSFGTTGSFPAAKTGQFSVGQPEETYSRRDRIVVQPAGASHGEFAVVSDPRRGKSVGQYDIDGGYVGATSPPIELPVTNPRLTMDRFWGHASLWDLTDRFSVGVLAEGSNEAEVIALTHDDGIYTGAWRTIQYDLHPWAGQTVRIQIMASDVGLGSLSEAGFDNVMVTGDVVQAPPAVTEPSTGEALQTATKLWSQDFETGVRIATWGDARTGHWNIGEPSPTAWRGFGLQQGEASNGIGALITDTEAGHRAGAYDVDKGSVVAEIAATTIPAGDPSAKFVFTFEWYLAHLDNATAGDGLTVTVVGEDDEQVVLDERGISAQRSNNWQTTRADISRFQGQTISIVVTATDDAKSGAVIEAGVDNMVITAINSPSPIVTVLPIDPPAPIPIVTVLPIDPPAPTPVVTVLPIDPPAPTPVVTVLPIDPPAPIPIVTVLPIDPPAPIPIVTVLPIDPPAPPLACVNDGWQTIGGAGQFTAEIPADLVNQDPQGIDSWVGEYTAPGLRVSFDYGWFSNPLTDLNDEVRPIITNGLPGTVRFAAGEPNMLGVYYPYMAALAYPVDKLNIIVSFDDPADRTTAECILQSVTLGETATPAASTQPLEPASTCAMNRTNWVGHNTPRFRVLLPPAMKRTDVDPIEGFDIEWGVFRSETTTSDFSFGYHIGTGLEEIVSPNDEVTEVRYGDIEGTRRFTSVGGQVFGDTIFFPVVETSTSLPTTAVQVMAESNDMNNRLVADCILESITWR